MSKIKNKATGITLELCKDFSTEKAWYKVVINDTNTQYKIGDKYLINKKYIGPGLLNEPID